VSHVTNDDAGGFVIKNKINARLKSWVN